MSGTRMFTNRSLDQTALPETLPWGSLVWYSSRYIMSTHSHNSSWHWNCQVVCIDWEVNQHIPPVAVFPVLSLQRVVTVIQGDCRAFTDESQLYWLCLGFSIRTPATLENYCPKEFGPYFSFNAGNGLFFLFHSVCNMDKRKLTDSSIHPNSVDRQISSSRLFCSDSWYPRQSEYTINDCSLQYLFRQQCFDPTPSIKQPLSRQQAHPLLECTGLNSGQLDFNMSDPWWDYSIMRSLKGLAGSQQQFRRDSALKL